LHRKQIPENKETQLQKKNIGEPLEQLCLRLLGYVNISHFSAYDVNQNRHIGDSVEYTELFFLKVARPR
jgi:regulator of sigma D